MQEEAVICLYFARSRERSIVISLSVCLSRYNVHNVYTMYIMYIICNDHHFSQANDGSPPNLHTMDSRSACIQDVLKVKVKVKGHVIRALLYWHDNRFLTIIGIRGIIHYSRQVCDLIFLAIQYSSPGGSTTTGEVCYLRLPCYSNDVIPRHRVLYTY